MHKNNGTLKNSSYTNMTSNNIILAGGARNCGKFIIDVMGRLKEKNDPPFERSYKNKEKLEY